MSFFDDMGQRFGLKQKTNSMFGLDIGSRSIKIAELEKTKNSIHLACFGSRGLPPGAIIDGKIMEQGIVVDTIKELTKELGIEKKEVCISTSGPAVIVKDISIPKVKSREVEDQVYWEAEQHLPFKIDEVKLDYEVIERLDEADDMRVLLAVVKKDFLDSHLSTIMEAGLEPKIVDIDTLALANIFWQNYDMLDEELSLLVDIGCSLTKINIVSKDKSLFVREIAAGGSNVTKEIQNSLGLDFDKAEVLKINAASGDKVPVEVKKCIDNGIEELSTEIGRYVDFATSNIEHKISNIYISGGSSRIFGFDKAIESTVETPVSYLNPFERIEYDPDIYGEEFIEEVFSFAPVSLALALRGL